MTARAIDAEHALFQKLAQQCAGQSNEAVTGAAANVLANCMRQQHADLRAAEAAIDALAARIKATLADKHYDRQGQRHSAIARTILEHAGLVTH